jgi:hypothetical protein
MDSPASIQLCRAAISAIADKSAVRGQEFGMAWKTLAEPEV